MLDKIMDVLADIGAIVGMITAISLCLLVLYGILDCIF